MKQKVDPRTGKALSNTPRGHFPPIVDISKIVEEETIESQITDLDVPETTQNPIEPILPIILEEMPLVPIIETPIKVEVLEEQPVKSKRRRRSK